MKRIFIIFSVVLFSLNVFSQAFKTVVKDTAHNPIAFANIVVLNQNDTSLVLGLVTDTNGVATFTLDNPKNKYSVISFIGYKSDTIWLNNWRQEVILQPDTAFIQTVEITAKRPLVRLVDNKLLYDAQVVREKKVVISAFDLIRELPSIVSTDENSLNISGSGGTSILINGRISSMNYSTLINYLKTLPAERVENVEISYNAPAEWGVKGAAINVLIKRERNYSYSGQVGTSFGKRKDVDDLGQINYNANAFFASPKWNFDFSYEGGVYEFPSKWEDYINHHVTDNAGNEKIFNISSKTDGETHGNRNNFYSSVSYSFSDSKYMSLSYVGNFTPTYRVDRNSDNSYTGVTKYNQNNDEQVQDVSLFYSYGKSKPDQVLTFNAGLEYMYYSKDLIQKTKYREYLEDGTLSSLEDAFNYSADQEINLVKGFLNVSNFLPKNWKLSYGGLFSYTDNRNKQKNLDLLGTDNYTNRSTIDEKRVRAYISVRKNFMNDHLNLDATLIDEYYNYHGYETNDLLPNITVSYAKTPKHIFQLFNISHRNHPSYWSLQDYTKREDKYTISKGNPNLRPDLINNTAFKYIFNQRYSLMLGYVYVKDNLLTQEIFLPDTLLKLEQAMNLEQTQYAYVALDVPIEIGKRFSSSFSISVRRQQYKTDDWFGLEFDNRFWQLDFYNRTSFVIMTKPRILLNLTFNYFSHGYAAMQEYDDQYQLHVSLYGQFFDSRLKCNITLFNLVDNSPYIRYCNQLGQDWKHYGNFYEKMIFIELSYTFKGYRQRQQKNVDTSRFGM